MSLFDVILRGGSILDGSGLPPFPADLAIQGEQIAAIGNLENIQAKTCLDAAGLIICPGFIDTHSHTDLTLFDEPSCWNKLQQGITTEIAGMCGLSLAPIPQGKALQVAETMPFLSAEAIGRLAQFPTFASCLTSYDRTCPGDNLAFFVGHGTLRAAVMGSSASEATASELSAMCSLLKEAMQAGALGISYGLIYPPGVYAQKDELVTLAKEAARWQGGITVHLRSEGNRLIESVEEMIEVAQQSGAYLLLSHHKAAGKRNWGKIHQTLELVKQAQNQGIEIYLDAYPYTSSSTTLKTLIPPRFHVEGAKGLIKLLATSSGRMRIREEMLHPSDETETQFANAGFDGTMIVDSPNHPESMGKSLAQIAQATDRDPFEVLFDILKDDELATMAAYAMMCEDDMNTLIGHPDVMIGTDGVSIPQGTAEAPRAVGTFPRILGRMVREQELLTLPEAVRKMTSLPAKAFRLEKRGLICKGYTADLVVFDPQTILDHATHLAFNAPNEGIRAVFVNGQLAVVDNKITGIQAGRILKNNKGIVV